jgi:hypothetical protein
MWDVVFLGVGLFAIFWLAVGPIVRNIFFGFIADIQIGDVFLDDLQRSCTVSAIGWTTISFKSDDGRRFVEMTHRDFYEKKFSNHEARSNFCVTCSKEQQQQREQQQR